MIGKKSGSLNNVKSGPPPLRSQTSSPGGAALWNKVQKSVSGGNMTASKPVAAANSTPAQTSPKKVDADSMWEMLQQKATLRRGSTSGATTGHQQAPSGRGVSPRRTAQMVTSNLSANPSPRASQVWHLFCLLCYCCSLSDSFTTRRPDLRWEIAAGFVIMRKSGSEEKLLAKQVTCGK